jgi:hypothetical protein
MIITFVDSSTSSATAANPTFHIIDTSAGLLQFVSAGASTPGSIDFNTVGFYTPATTAEWAYLQMRVALAIQQGLTSLSFVPATTTVLTSASGISHTGGTSTLVGLGFQAGMTVSLDVSSGSAYNVQNCGTATVVSSKSATITIQPTTAGTYNMTIFNPDGSYAVLVNAIVIS